MCGLVHGHRHTRRGLSQGMALLYRRIVFVFLVMISFVICFIFIVVIVVVVMFIVTRENVHKKNHKKKKKRATSCRRGGNSGQSFHIWPRAKQRRQNDNVCKGLCVPARKRWACKHKVRRRRIERFSSHYSAFKFLDEFFTLLGREAWSTTWSTEMGVALDHGRSFWLARKYIQ